MRLIGFSWTSDTLTFVHEYAQRQDMLSVLSRSHLDWDFTLLFAFDLVQVGNDLPPKVENLRFSEHIMFFVCCHQRKGFG